MIESLTDEQTAKFDDYCKTWLAHGLSTAPIDVDKSVELLRQVYEQKGYTFPNKVEVYDSPYEAIDQMKIRHGVDVTVGDFEYGSFESGDMSFYDYFLNETDIEDCEMIKPFVELSKVCGWVLLYDEMVVLTQRPMKIMQDAEGLTHCEDGLAIEYPDGQGVAVWHGTSIPEEWVLDKSTITPDVMFKWTNIEERRCACEIIGWGTVLEQLKAVDIDVDVDPEVGKLVEVDLPDSGKEKFLVVLDPNVNGMVGIPVPPEMTTALEANSWTYGIDKFDFKPEFRV